MMAEDGPDYSALDDLLSESDRGCVLIAQSLLEERLGDQIEAYLLSEEGAIGHLLSELRQGRSNPLGSFAASIDYAVRVKVITGETANALRRINQLRKEFAHYKPPRPMLIEMWQANEGWKLLSDEQRTIASKLELALTSETFKRSPGYREYNEGRQKFMASAWTLLGQLRP
jgi:hypothetical protein